MKFIKPLIVGIVFLIIAITMIGSLASTVDDSAEDITFDDRCNTLSTCIYNETVSATVPCRNSTNQSNACATSINGEYPLASLFNTGGIVILMFIAGGLVIAVGTVFSMYKKKT